VSHDITGKPRLGKFLKIYPVGASPNAGNPRLVLNLRFQYKKSPLIDLYQAFNMNPVNFVDPFGKQHWIIEEELAGQIALKEHLKKRYGTAKGEQYYKEITDTKRRIETIMVASFGVGLGTAMVAPHLSVPAIVATVGSISTYSALESYSSRKQAGQTEREARRGAFGAATGINFLFNLMGFDYGTLEGVSQEQVENAWSTLIGGIFGGWLAKTFAAPKVEINKMGVQDTYNNLGTKFIRGEKLSRKLAKTFKGGKYIRRVLKEDEIFYRYHGVDNRLRPFTFVSKTKYSSQTLMRIRLAIMKKWGVKITNVSKIKVPAGNIVYEGKAASQSLYYFGGGHQAIIKHPSKSWILNTTEF
jgi:hypothetical protein